MSATMQGYFLWVPTDRWQRLLDEQTQRIMRALGEEDLNDHQRIHALSELCGVQTEYIAESNGLESDDEEEILDCVRNLLDVARQFNVTTDWRDLADGIQHINGQEVRVMFAGDSTHGDEPDGDGYLVLRAMCILGYYDVFHAAINWGPREPRAPNPHAVADPNRQASVAPRRQDEDPHRN